jgi:hypothetical protein
MKAEPSPLQIKHYKCVACWYYLFMIIRKKISSFRDGEFNVDYDRKHTVQVGSSVIFFIFHNIIYHFQSMCNFLRDPTGDIPWEEDATATDVVHIDSTKVIYD